MKILQTAAALALSLALGGLAVAESAPSARPSPPVETRQSWPVEPKWRGPGPMPRHYITQLWGIPAPYAEMTNPQAERSTIQQRGAAVYARDCASCHGDNGVGDGPAGRELKPPPGNLVWLSDVPRKQWDAYMYWTIAEGGVPLGTAMPAYKDTLSRDDIWAVIAYVQANLPFESHFELHSH